MAKNSTPTLAEYNNNPGNLKPPKDVVYEGQLGLDEHGFAIFEKPEYGRKALVNDIKYKLKNGLMTPEDFVNKFAPAGDENSEDSRDNYKLHITHNLGLKSSKDEFPEGSEEKLADLITSFETGKPIPQQEKKEEESGTATEAGTPPGGNVKTSKDRPISPIVGGVAGATAGATLGHPIALYKSYYDLARSAAGMMPRTEPTMGIEPTFEPPISAGEPELTGGDKWAKNWAGQDRSGMSVPEASAAYQRSKGQGKVSGRMSKMWGPSEPAEPGVFKPGRLSLAPSTTPEPVLAAAEDEAARLAARTQPGPVTSALGQIVKNWMIPIRGGLAGFGTGFGALDAYNRANAGDTPGSVAAGIGAAASALSPFVPYAGPLSIAIPIGLYARDKMTQMTPEQARAHDEEIKRLGYDPSFNP